MSCKNIELRSEIVSVEDVRTIFPANSKARIVDVGEGVGMGTMTIAVSGAGSMSSGKCKVFSGAMSSTSGYVKSSSVTANSGTPYTVVTVSMEG